MVEPLEILESLISEKWRQYNTMEPRLFKELHPDLSAGAIEGNKIAVKDIQQQQQLNKVVLKKWCIRGHRISSFTPLGSTNGKEAS